jgi:hypothetical protein
VGFVGGRWIRWAGEREGSGVGSIGATRTRGLKEGMEGGREGRREKEEGLKQVKETREGGREL